MDKALTEEIEDAEIYIEALQWLRKNKPEVLSDINQHDDWMEFEFPHYFGMPTSIAGRLDQDMIERISELTESWVKYG